MDLKYEVSDIWNYATGDNTIVVPVNLDLICGRGLAKQWKDRYPSEYKFVVKSPELMNTFRDQAPKDVPDFVESILKPESFFFECISTNAKTPTIVAIFYYGLILVNSVILLPVKYHWRETASLELIEKSLKKLNNLTLLKKLNVYLPKVGCGFGEDIIHTFSQER